MVLCQLGSEDVDGLSILFSYSSFRIESSFQLVGSTGVQISCVCGAGFIAESMFGYSILFLPLLDILKASGDCVIISPYQMLEHRFIERRTKVIEHTVRLDYT
jgi:hypothetical protein